MTENIPPNNASGDASRGMPYYEKLKRDLRETLVKKRKVDKDMLALEERIHQVETAYLEETPAGNIIKGFDNYIKGSTASATGGAGGGAGPRRKTGISDQDRVFSRSSANFAKEPSPSASAHTTPSGAPTPTSSHALASGRASDHPTPTSTTSTKGNAGTKRQKKGTERDEEETDSKPTKRLKVSYGRDKGD